MQDPEVTAKMHDQTRHWASPSIVALVALASFASAQLVGTSAFAQPCDVDRDLDHARHALEEAGFEEVDGALDRVSRCALDRPALSRWLVLRTLVSYADERLGALDESLRGLVSLRLPERPALLPPSVARRYDELWETSPPIELGAALVVEPFEGRRRIGVVPRHVTDPGRLVRHVEVHARIGRTPFRLLAPDERLDLPDLESTVTVDVVLRGLGPGGALLVTQGEERDPLRLVVEGVPPNRRPLVIGLTLAAAFFVVAGVALAIAGVLTDGFRNGETRATPTMRLVE
jgi:hypothetical protein